MCSDNQSALTVYADNKVYASVNCYLCNKRSRPTCSLDDSDRKFATEFGFLLNLPPLKESQRQIDPKIYVCSEQEFHDKFFGTCRAIRCPTFEVLTNGKCISVVEIGRFNYEFKFVVDSYRQKQSDADVPEVEKALTAAINTKLALENCSMCSIIIRSRSLAVSPESVAMLYLEIVYTTSRQCERDLLLSSAAKLEESQEANLTLKIDVGSMSFEIEYIPSLEIYRKMKVGSKLMYVHLICIGPSFDPSKFINCPKVTLSVKEYESIVYKDELRNLQAAKIDKGFEVCLDDYKTFSSTVESDGYYAGSSIWLYGYCLILEGMLERLAA